MKVSLSDIFPTKYDVPQFEQSANSCIWLKAPAFSHAAQVRCRVKEKFEVPVGCSGEIQTKAPLSQIKVIAFKDKHEWNLEPKYNIGKKKEDEQSNESTKV